MAHPLVEQLRFTRGEFRRGLDGVSEADGTRRLTPMNSISWMVGHMAWHEQLYWLRRAQGLTPRPDLDAFASGRPAGTPSLARMWSAWADVTLAADAFLEGLTRADLLQPLAHDSRPDGPSAGTMLQRVIYHYWLHTGEATAVRQILGHPGVPEFVGDIDHQAPYRTEPDR